MSEWKRFIARAVFVAGLAVAVGWQLTRAWIPDSPAYKLVEAFHPIFDVGVGTPVELFPSAALGLWFGLVAAMTADWRKHFHGILLFLGSTIAVVTVTALGLLIANIDIFALPNQVAFGIGFILPIAVEHKTIKKAISYRLSSDSRTNFATDEIDIDDSLETDGTNETSIQANRAILGVAVFSGIILIAALFNLFAMGSITAVDPIITAGFGYSMVLFMAYNIRSDTQVVGPPSSGKTYLLIGLYKEFSERAKIALDESDGMTKAIKDISNKTEGSGFELPSTEGYEEFSFHYDVGELFPVRVKFDTYDHRGEYLRDYLVPAAESEDGIRTSLYRLMLTIKNQLSERNITSSLSSSQKIDLISHRILNSDQIVITIDINRIIQNNQAPEIEALRKVASRVKKNGGEVIVVATKADLFIEEVVNDNIKSVNNGDVPTLPETRKSEFEQILTDGFGSSRQVFSDNQDYADFAAVVTEWINTQYQGQSKNLIKMSSYRFIFPVFYRTARKNSNGTVALDGSVDKQNQSDESDEGQIIEKPLLDEGQNLQPVGFDYLGDILEVDR